MRFFQRDPEPERPRAGVFGTGKCDDCDCRWHPYYTCECGCTSWRERMQPTSRWTRRGFLHLLAGATAAVIAAPAVKMLAPEPEVVGFRLYASGGGGGKPVFIASYDRLGLPTEPLTEGIVPTSVRLAVQYAQADIDPHLFKRWAGAEPDGGGA